MAVVKFVASGCPMRNALDYVTRDEATERKLVDGIRFALDKICDVINEELIQATMIGQQVPEMFGVTKKTASYSTKGTKRNVLYSGSLIRRRDTPASTRLRRRSSVPLSARSSSTSAK